jgi:group I intron endonuclease
MQKYYIYKIECLENGKVYIGQTKNPNKRKNEHFNDLRNNRHHSILLQRAYNKYGEEKFKHTIIEECDINSVDEREIFWINYYNSNNKNNGFNLDGGGNSNKTISDYTREIRRKIAKKNYNPKILNSEEAIKKKSKKLSGKGNPMYGKTPREWMDEDTYRKWVEDKRQRLLLNNPMKGKKHTQEARLKISKATKGKNNPFYGKHHTDEVKQYLSKIRSGTNSVNARKVLCINNGIVYDTITQASKLLNVDGSCISKVCRGKIKQIKGYRFEYVKES